MAGVKLNERQLKEAIEETVSTYLGKVFANNGWQYTMNAIRMIVERLVDKYGFSPAGAVDEINSVLSHFSADDLYGDSKYEKDYD